MEDRWAKLKAMFRDAGFRRQPLYDFDTTAVRRYWAPLNRIASVDQVDDNDKVPSLMVVFHEVRKPNGELVQESVSMDVGGEADGFPVSMNVYSISREEVEADFDIVNRVWKTLARAWDTYAKTIRDLTI